MKALSVLVIVAASVVASFTVTSPADAVGETCNGLAATLVGTPGSTVTGTDGPDVIVSNGATQVYGGAGDDVICSTGSGSPTLGGAISSVNLLGEAGNDLLDRRGDLDPSAVGFSIPGPGQDQVFGSPYADYVNGVDGEPDVISTGAGHDQVSGGDQPVPEPDVIDLGPDSDSFDVGSPFSVPLSVSGGDGTDGISFSLPQEDRTWVVDAGRGEVRLAGRTVTATSSFGGFESYSVSSHNVKTPTRWRFEGSDGPDRVTVFPGVRGVDLLGGDDELNLAFVTGRRTVDFRGGPGRDTLVVGYSKKVPVRLDLSAGWLDVGDRRGRVTKFEDAEVYGSMLDVVGTGKDNAFTLTSCGLATVRGLGGDDTLSVARLNNDSCGPGVVRTAYGGAGNDALTGSEDADLLDGGRGHDTGDGGAGRDACVSVEVRTSCGRRKD